MSARDSQSGQDDSENDETRRDDVLRRMLATPPKPKPVVKPKPLKPIRNKPQLQANSENQKASD